MSIFNKKAKSIKVGDENIVLQPKPSFFSRNKKAKSPTDANTPQASPASLSSSFQQTTQNAAALSPSSPQDTYPEANYGPAADNGNTSKEQKKQDKKPNAFDLYIDKLASKNKDLATALPLHNIKGSVEDFIKRMFFASLIFGLMIGFVTFVILYKLNLPRMTLAMDLVLSAVMALVVERISFSNFIKYPLKGKSKDSSKYIERDILFAARDLIISLRSGIPLYNGIVSISTGYGAASNEFGKIVERVQVGMPLTEAIDQVIAQTKSPSFRRLMLQASVTIKTGADIIPAMQTTINELSQERVIELRRYGQKLNAIAMFYMLFGVILPSMGLAVATILTTFIPLITINVTILEMAAVGIVFLQIIFLQMIRNSRPVFSM
ncbi:MAG: type II secretion system F family protein [Candidatus Micrarchaeia archaeon]